MHICWLADLRGTLAEWLGIRRERMVPTKPCKPNCCGHGHVFCKPMHSRHRD